MKRTETLAPLSREHHTSLILAQLLKKDAPAYKGLPDTIEGKVVYARLQFEKDIKTHFEKEELMLDKAKDCNDVISRLTEEIKKEHRELAALFHSLNAEMSQADQLDELGRKLEDHIRKEERVLFPLLQQHCSAELLQQIHEVLH